MSERSSEQSLYPAAGGPDPRFAAQLAAARAGDHQAFSNLVGPFQRELQFHCYRILGSLQDAEDLLQETLLRAWQRLDTFASRGTLRAWLYKIATNACLDALDKRSRRLLPPAAFPASPGHAALQPPNFEITWLEPYPDEWLAGLEVTPEAHYAARESVSLAFLAALQFLPPRQRAVLILRDVLDWRAEEVARLLDTTVSSVNSALFRARATLAGRYPAEERQSSAAQPGDRSTQELLDRYLRAWESADVSALVALLKEDATFSMPPSPSWFRGQEDIRRVLAAVVFPGGERGRWRLVPTGANGQPAFAVYQVGEPGQTGKAFGIQVLTLGSLPSGACIGEVTTFLRPALFPRFGFPIKQQT